LRDLQALQLTLQSQNITTTNESATHAV